VNPYVVLILEALLFALAFGALTWLRGEGLPGRFAWEVLGVTAVLLALSWVARTPMHPVLFLVLIYVVTMRARLLVDLANALSARRKYEGALSILRLALRLASDPISQTLVQINTGVVMIRQKRFEEAIQFLSSTLQEIPAGRGGPKYEAACRYNLGLAHLRAGQDSQAAEQFNAVIELLPNSLYARGAETALARRKGRDQQ
jgi:tetratricopeptide (TPR) repeat protein